MAGTGILQQHSYRPPNGFVPDSVTAVRVAEAVLTPVYGPDQVARELPLSATLKGKIWVVRGHNPSGSVGGAALVEIAKSDARILRMTHGK